MSTANTPFFARFLETQLETRQPAVRTGLKAGTDASAATATTERQRTQKAPSDFDEYVTMKYPSDDDEYRGNW